MAYYDPNTGFATNAQPEWLRGLPGFSLDSAPQPNLFASGLASGWHEALGNIGGTAQAIGSRLGMPGVASWGQGVAESQEGQAQAAGRPDLEANPWSLKGIAYNVTKSLPTIAGSLGAGALAALGIGSLGTGIPEAVATGLGAGAFMYPQVVGGNVQAAEQANKGQLSPGNAGKALVLGVPEAAAMSVMPTRLSGMITKGAEGSFGKRLLTGSLSTAAYQAPLSAANTALTQDAFTPDMPIADRARAIIGSALSGGIQGAVFGGAVSAFRPKIAPLQNTPADQVSDQNLKDATGPILGIPSPEKMSPLPRNAGDYSDTQNPDLLAMLQPLTNKGINRSPAENVQHALLQQEAAKRTTPGLPVGEGPLFTPEEIAAREPLAKALKEKVLETVPKAADEPFFQNFNATTEPELINALGAQVEQSGKKLPAWLKTLSDTLGVTGPSPEERIVDLREQAVQSVAARDAAMKAGNVPAMRAANGAVIDLNSKLVDVRRLLDLHEQADKLLPQAPIEDVTGQLNLPGLGEKPVAPQTVIPATEAPPAVPEGQKELFSSTESGEARQARQQAVQGFQDSLLSHLPPKVVARIEPFVRSLDAASEPELINALKSHVSDADETANGVLSPAAKFLTNEYGITDKTGGPRDLVAERDELQGQYDDLLDRASKSQGDGQKGMFVEQAMKIRNGPLSSMNGLLDLHDQADALNVEQPTTEIPDRVPQGLRGQWATLGAIKDSSNVDLAKAADTAQRAIEQDIPEARRIAQLTINRYANASRNKVVTEKTNAVREPGAAGVDVQQLSENGGAVAEGHTEGNVAAEEAAPGQVGEAAKVPTREEQVAKLGSNLPPEPATVKVPLPAPDRDKLRAIYDAEPEGSETKNFASKALGMADAVTNKKQKDQIISNALATLSRKDVVPFRSDVQAVPQETDTALAHIVGMGGTGKDVTGYLALNGDRMTKVYAGLLHSLGVDPKIQFSARPDEPENRFGPMIAGYDNNTDTIHLFQNIDLQTNLLHELTHSATWKALDKLTPAAREMQRLFQHVKGMNPGARDLYGLQDVHEFVAEAFGNPRFAEFLRQLPVETGSRVANVWQSLKNTVFRMLGMPERARTMFDQVMETGHELMGENTKVGSVADTTHQMMSAASTATTMSDNFFARRGVARQKIDEALRDAGVGSEARAVKVAKLWTYFGTMQSLANDFGHLFKSGGLTALRLAGQARTALGNQYSGLAYLARQKVNALDSKLQTDLKEAMRLMTTHGANALPWDQQPWLHDRVDAQAMRPVVDRINGLMSSIRQRGGMPAYNEMLAFNEMEHLSNLGDFLQKSKTDDFARLNVIGYAGDQFADFQNDNEAHKSNLVARDRAAEVVRQQLGAYKSVAGKLTNELTSLPVDDPQRESIRGKIDSLNSKVKVVEDNLTSMMQSPYFHMGRTGEYAVSTNLAMDPIDDTKISQKAVNALQDALIKGHFNDAVINGDINNPKVFIRVDGPDDLKQLHAVVSSLEKDGHVSGTRQGSLMNGEFRKNALSSALDEYISGVAHSSDIDDEDQQKVLDQLRRIRIDMMPDHRLVWQARQNVQGPSPDMIRSFVKRSQIAANSLANMGTAQKVADAMGGMRADIEGAKAGNNTRQVLMMQTVMNELQTREANRIWRPTHTALDTMRSFVHAWYLGISPAYFALELSQMAIGAVPEMAGHAGYARATSAVAKNLPMTFRVMRWIAAGGLGKYATPTEGDNLKFGVPDSVAKFVLGVSNQGLLESGSMTHALGIGAVEGVAKKIDTALHWANITALYTEVAMRVNVALASRDLHNFRAFEGIGAYGPGLDAFVNKNLNEGLQDFSPSNQSRALGKQGFAGKFTPTATQFSGWQLRMIQKLYTEVHGLIGAQREGETAEDTKARRLASGQFLAGHLGAVGVLSGALGLPMLQTVLGASSNLANSLSGTEQFDFENNFRQYLSGMFGKEFGDAVARGVPHLAGVDLSDFGDASLVPFSQFLADQRSFQDAAQDMAWHSLGSSTSFVANIIRAFSDFSHGDALDGMKESLPASLKGPYEAYLMSQYGYENRSGLKAQVQPSSADVAKKALGLEPANMRQVEDENQELENIKARRELVTSYLRSNFERAYAHGQSMQQPLGNVYSYMGRNPGIFMNPGEMLMQQLQKQTLSRAMGMPPGVPLMDIQARKMLQPYYLGGQQ